MADWNSIVYFYLSELCQLFCCKWLAIFLNYNKVQKHNNLFQISIFEVRSDGIDNFLSSLLVAGNFVIPEVTLFFSYKLLRGNRTTKVSSESFQAFHSPNTPPLAIAGIHFEGILDLFLFKIFYRCRLLLKNRILFILKMFMSKQIAYSNK